MITWGISGRGDNRRASVFCLDCREVFVSGIQVENALREKGKAEKIHKCSGSSHATGAAK